ncbi:MAG: hypothetical protein A4E52_01007 [Pelotomaculum sp. PtaB.Bin013]|uniref:SEC-C domain-containing protein n=1 Tax=Pelotomaculum isophthalicicum JI TaxID=947010 RepID=A0A9X4H0N2_9FIRM|nr:SEC-C metal-binding domain-containing protein [Pelotomaculum isophthalicicum]MDF9409965.1 SEC-C domain-containing protein [Pelotomaculum isophthalicicum JI]OPX89408.1 MAG: hypothetical protein A4E52_01007 [Pelotomaculum sp. PtaB.Bin013]
MDSRIDEITQNALLEALEKAKDYSRQLQEKREQRLWREINIPCNLSDALRRLSKNELSKIRQTLGFKNLSSLKKGELICKLVNLIPAKFKNIIYTFDRERYSLAKRMLKNKGCVTANGIPIFKVESLVRYGIAFPGVHHDQKILCMPLELMNIFKEIDGNELESIVRRNTEWIKLTQGLLYYYGVMGALSINKMINQLTGQEADLVGYIGVLSAASDYYGQIMLSAYGYQDHRVFDAKKIIDEQKMRPGVHYYPFTKQQLLKAGEPDFIERTPAMSKLIRFLLEYYDLSDEEINEMMLQLIDMINLDMMPTRMIEYLGSWLEFPSFDMVRELTAKLTELCNHTRMWILKGHTPNELSQEEKKHLKPMPAEPFKLNQTDSNIYNIRTGAKIGRNDPCPCGSGKKYKKCCGK